MAATVTKLATRQRVTTAGGGPTVRTAIDAFLDSPKVKASPNDPGSSMSPLGN